MCENVEIDITDETLKNLTAIIRSSLKESADPCSFSKFDDTDIETYDDLLYAVGSVVINQTLVKIIEEGIKSVEEEHGPLSQRKV